MRARVILINRICLVNNRYRWFVTHNTDDENIVFEIRKTRKNVYKNKTKTFYARRFPVNSF